MNTYKQRLKELLENPRSGLKDSSNTNKTYSEIMGLIDEVEAKTLSYVHRWQESREQLRKMYIERHGENLPGELLELALEVSGKQARSQALREAEEAAGENPMTETDEAVRKLSIELAIAFGRYNTEFVDRLAGSISGIVYTLRRSLQAHD